MGTILITGAYRGLGLETARMLVAKGHRVIVGARDAERAGRGAREAGAEPLVLDVTSRSSRETALIELRARFGSLDVLVNNAAVLLDGGTGLLQLGGDALERTFAVNAIAPVEVVRAFLPLLRASPAPRIVNVSSGAGQMDGEASAWAAAYSASKAALNMLTRQLALALPGVAVNAVCPGWCRTEMGGPQAPRSAAEGADTIAWLAAEAPHDLTGRFFRDRREIPW